MQPLCNLLMWKTWLSGALLSRSACIGRQKEFALITNAAFQVLLDTEIFVSGADITPIEPSCTAHFGETVHTLSSFFLKNMSI